eukprot:CAMPEP_0196664480 /NCGR_PEP_ID=MMETSP1086-20130531/57339_1 /TAXON_ID=77921 /ORGANISM="Cyanoptyche  gloeocystis , Strain SAG4.97" /LENGTH=80 /DNA_ID=CAMNT_0042000811 /DNA_START=664 /DNA_END=907 /DNA_ORIENTATION=+
MSRWFWEWRGLNRRLARYPFERLNLGTERRAQAFVEVRLASWAAALTALHDPYEPLVLGMAGGKPLRIWGWSPAPSWRVF